MCVFFEQCRENSKRYCLSSACAICHLCLIWVSPLQLTQRTLTYVLGNKYNLEKYILHSALLSLSIRVGAVYCGTAHSTQAYLPAPPVAQWGRVTLPLEAHLKRHTVLGKSSVIGSTSSTFEKTLCTEQKLSYRQHKQHI